MSHLRIEANITAADMAADCGYRQYDPTFDLAYSNLTPDTVEECMAKWRENLWRPFRIFGGDDLLAFHYLHNFNGAARSAWCSGFLFPDARGPRIYEQSLRRALWSAALWHISRNWNYTHIFCYAMAQNPPAAVWIEDQCQFARVGVMLGAVPENDGYADIIVFSQIEADTRMCRCQAEEMFPRGTWED